MSVRLPHPIDIYIALENSPDSGDVADCFAADAVVRDEGGTHKGLAAIAQWLAGTKKKYNHVIEPLGLRKQGGRTVLKAKLAGDFPGSPITLEFSFLLKQRKIAALEIG
jgi:hypothetical protein